MNVSLNAPRFREGRSGGIVLAFTLDPVSAQQQQQPRPLPGSLGGNRMLDAWIRINADGTATVFTGKVELGQGIVTALAQIAAEELDLPLGRVDMISGDTGRTPNEGMTAGSQSIENTGTALRLAGGGGACASWSSSLRQSSGSSADSLSVADGVISAANGKQDRLRRACGRRSTSSARRPRRCAPKPAGAAQDRRPVDRALRHSRQSHRQGDATCRTCACPAWCMAAWCGRRAMARRWSRSTRPRRARCPA